MATVNLQNEFLSYALTDEELASALKFRDPALVYLNLKNMLSDVMRQLAYLEFTPEKQELSLKQHIHLSGQRDVLLALIAGYEEPIPDAAPGNEQQNLL